MSHTLDIVDDTRGCLLLDCTGYTVEVHVAFAEAGDEPGSGFTLTNAEVRTLHAYLTNVVARLDERRKP